MTAKEYLEQAYRIDQRINSKLEQATSLKELTLKASSVLSDMPKGIHNIHSKETIIAKMLDLEDEINDDIDKLVSLKKEILTVIKSVDRAEYQTLLEMRYLCFRTWEQIAVELGYGIDNIFRMHKQALSFIKIPEKIQ